MWRTLFIERTPLSEATSGVACVLTALGLDPRAEDLREARAFFAAQDPGEHLARVLDLAGVAEVVATNDPFDPAERPVWQNRRALDHRFHAALRLDSLLLAWPRTWARVREEGYQVQAEITDGTLQEVRRFLSNWVERMRPRYLAASLPPDLTLSDPRADLLLREAVLLFSAEHDLPFAAMIGVRRAVNPRLGLAGDGSGSTNLEELEALLRDYPGNRFLVTLLAREDQHPLCVLARKFANLMPFGCWWFLNNPLAHLGDHANAAGDARHVVPAAALRRAGAGAVDL